jgi:fructokinase
MRIGIDLGGTKIEGVVLDHAGDTVIRRRRPTPASQGYHAILLSIVDMVCELESKVGQRCHVGIGVPGAISTHTGGLKNSNTVCLNGKPIKQDLERKLDREIRLENDANCFTLSEAIDGAAREYAVVFGVIMGTGVGGGIVCNKTLHAGPQHIAGEWGHNVLIADGRPCYCGKRGCVETYLSGSGLIYDCPPDQPITAQQLIVKADSGDKHAEQLVNVFLQRFGLAMATVINILDPDVIVMGGGLSNIEHLYTTGTEEVMRHVFNDEPRIRLLRNKHGDSSGVRGAAQLWPAN